MLYSLLYLAISALLIWSIIRIYKQNPQIFSKENISKSFTTVGLLALMIIAVVVLAVLILKA